MPLTFSQTLDTDKGLCQGEDVKAPATRERPGARSKPRKGLDMSNGNSENATRATVNELLTLRERALEGYDPTGGLSSEAPFERATGIAQVVAVAVGGMPAEELVERYTRRAVESVEALDYEADVLDVLRDAWLAGVEAAALVAGVSLPDMMQGDDGRVLVGYGLTV